MKRVDRIPVSLRIAAMTAALSLAMNASADGTTDPQFGSAGVVKISFPGSTDGGIQAAAMVNGQLEVAGFGPLPDESIRALNTPLPLYIAQLSATGAVLSAMVVAQGAIQNPISVAVDSNGNIFAAGANFDPKLLEHAAVVWFNPSGQIVSSYVRPAIATEESACLSENRELLLDRRGAIVVPCIYGPLSQAGERFSAVVLRLIPQNSALTPDAAFGDNGWQIVNLPRTTFRVMALHP